MAHVYVKNDESASAGIYTPLFMVPLPVLYSWVLLIWHMMIIAPLCTALWEGPEF